jgi:hypothetical protein
MKKEEFAPWELAHDFQYAAPDKEKTFPPTTGRPVALFGGDQTRPMLQS